MTEITKETVIAREPATAAISAYGSIPLLINVWGSLHSVRDDYPHFSVRISAFLVHTNMNNRSYYIYILTNKYNRVLYTGITNDLVRRVCEHRNSNKGFTGKYNVHKLVYIEEFDSPESAIEREKKIKAGSREKKIELIEDLNPEWRDLYEEVVGWHE